MVIITLFTIGFQEVHSLSSYGRLFTILIAVSGVGAFVYAGIRLIEIIVEGEILGYGRRRKMDRKIKDMKNHYIICGYGRTRKGDMFVVIGTQEQIVQLDKMLR